MEVFHNPTTLIPLCSYLLIPFNMHTYFKWASPKMAETFDAYFCLPFYHKHSATYHCSLPRYLFSRMPNVLLC